MSALITKITTFFSAVMTMITGGSIGSGDTAVTVTGLTDTIVGSDLLVLGVIAVPLVGISVGLPVPSARVKKKARGSANAPPRFSPILRRFL